MESRMSPELLVEVKNMLEGLRLAVETLDQCSHDQKSQDKIAYQENKEKDHPSVEFFPPSSFMTQLQDELNKTQLNNEKWLSQRAFIPDLKCDVATVSAFMIIGAGLLASGSFAKLSWDDGDTLCMKILLAAASMTTNIPMSLYYGFAYSSEMKTAIDYITHSDYPKVGLSLLVVACLLAIQPALGGVALGEQAWETILGDAFWLSSVGLAFNYLSTRSLGMIKQIVHAYKYFSLEGEISRALLACESSSHALGAVLDMSQVKSKVNDGSVFSDMLARFLSNVPLSCLNTTLVVFTVNCMFNVWKGKSSEGWLDVVDIFHALPEDWSKVSGWVGGIVHTYFYAYVMGMNLVESVFDILPSVARELYNDAGYSFIFKLSFIVCLFSASLSGASMCTAAKGVSAVWPLPYLNNFESPSVFIAVSAVNVDGVIRFFSMLSQSSDNKIVNEIKMRCAKLIEDRDNAKPVVKQDDPKTSQLLLTSSPCGVFCKDIPSAVKSTLEKCIPDSESGDAPSNSWDSCDYAVTFLASVSNKNDALRCLMDNCGENNNYHISNS